MDFMKALKAMTSLQKVFLLIALATVMCSIFTDCLLCKRWPLTVDARWRNPMEGFEADARLVLYKSSSCPHCIAMMPEWEKVVAAAASMGLQVQTMDDAEDPKEIIAAQVDSVPTIKLYKGGQVVQYGGERTAEAIERRVKSQ